MSVGLVLLDLSRRQFVVMNVALSGDIDKQAARSGRMVRYVGRIGSGKLALAGSDM